LTWPTTLANAVVCRCCRATMAVDLTIPRGIGFGPIDFSAYPSLEAQTDFVTAYLTARCGRLVAHLSYTPNPLSLRR
jgi:hypothetical protein